MIWAIFENEARVSCPQITSWLTENLGFDLEHSKVLPESLGFDRNGEGYLFEVIVTNAEEAKHARGHPRRLRNKAKVKPVASPSSHVSSASLPSLTCTSSTGMGRVKLQCSSKL